MNTISNFWHIVCALHLLSADLQVHGSTTLYYWWTRSCAIWGSNTAAEGMDSKCIKGM